MRTRSRSLVILLCLFLISFKVAASSIFIDAAIERAQIHQAVFAGFVAEKSHASKETSEGQQQVHTLFLMSHVIANLSDTSIITPFRSPKATVFNYSGDILCTQTFPDSAFKPPKSIAWFSWVWDWLSSANSPVSILLIIFSLYWEISSCLSW